MSNIDKRALREAAKAVGKNDWQYVYTIDLSAPGRGYITVGGAEAIYCLNKATGGVKQSENVLRYIAAANPATFLALLDELEAKDKQIDTLRQDKDKVIDMSKERISKLLARVAELEDSHSKLREAMAGIHNTITGGGAYTPLAAILNASKRAYDESAAAAGKGE
ncbi:ead/Ea22-like family protein [Enterobacter sp. CFEC121]